MLPFEAEEEEMTGQEEEGGGIFLNITSGSGVPETGQGWQLLNPHGLPFVSTLALQGVSPLVGSDSRERKG